MSNPSFNKYKSTTIFGKLAVRDLTNSAGTTVIENAETDLSGNFLCRGDATFTKAITCNGTITNAKSLTTKEYVDNAVSSGSGSALLTSANNWTNLNTFNQFFPSSSLPTTTVITNNSIVNKGMLDTIYQTIANMSNYLTTATASTTYSTKTNEVKTNTANTFTSTNTFSNSITCNGSVSNAKHLTTKEYVDTITNSSASGGGYFVLVCEYNGVPTNSGFFSFGANTGSSAIRTIMPNCALIAVRCEVNAALTTSNKTTIVVQRNDSAFNSGMSTFLTGEVLKTSSVSAGTLNAAYYTEGDTFSVRFNNTGSNTGGNLWRASFIFRTNANVLASSNTWLSNNSFNQFFPTSSLPNTTVITDDSIVNKRMLDTIYATIDSLNETNTSITNVNTYASDNFTNVYSSIDNLSNNIINNYASKDSLNDTNTAINNVSNEISTYYLTKGEATDTYQTKSDMGSYLTTATASATYQLLENMGDYLTNANLASTYQTIAGMGNYLTTANAASTYQLIENMDNYLTTAAASTIYQTIGVLDDYLTTASASSIYQMRAHMSNYLTTENATSTYQTITGMSSYLSSANATSTYQTITGMSNYLTTTDASTTYATITSLGSYLTTATASSTYQTISDMTNYLTTTAASSTYQTITGMSSYLTTATASSTYQTITGMSSYLTSATAASTYSTKSNEVKANTANTFTETNNFTTLSTTNFIRAPTSSDTSVGFYKYSYTQLFTNNGTYLNDYTDLITFSLPTQNVAYGVWYINYSVNFDYYISPYNAGIVEIMLDGNSQTQTLINSYATYTPPPDTVGTLLINSYRLDSNSGGSGSGGNFGNCVLSGIVKCYENKNPFKIKLRGITTSYRLYYTNYFSAVRIA